MTRSGSSAPRRQRGTCETRRDKEGGLGGCSYIDAMKPILPRLLIPVLVTVAVALGGCATRHDASGPPSTGRLYHLGNHSFRVTAGNPEAQRAFDRGLTLAYAFSHRAASEEFHRAADADPKCMMAWWGVALVNGPHINFPAVPPENARAASEAIGKAMALSASAPATPLERDLVLALEKRYADPQPADRGPLDTAYADAMRAVSGKYPDNADVAVLAAEAQMDLHPWNLWMASGEPQPWTPSIVEDLERALRLNPRHPGATHLYIHAIEASPHPERALAAADRLRDLVPGASHLVHMPAHIYARVGQWEKAAIANDKAMKVDEVYRATFPQPGFYAMYMAHNTHFLAFTAMMRGHADEAVRLARAMVASVPDEFVKGQAPIADSYMIFVSETLMRFGRWDEILAEPRPRPGLPLSLALWHFTRAVALTALDRPAEAAAEREEFRSTSAAVPSNWRVGNDAASSVLAVAAKQLDGEMSARAGREAEAIATLREAAALEDGLHYDEPPDWLQPVRHTLGAVLVRAGRAAEAETVYREDLAKYPGNGWSLYGLSRALKAQGKAEESRDALGRFRKAWASADIKPDSSCLCLPLR